MKILNNINSKIVSNNPNFTSERTDKATILQLKTGENIITENNEDNIKNSLNSLSTNPNRFNVEFLLDVADNLAYGEFGNKQFKAELNNDGITPEERENTKWSELLGDTIKRAISSSNEDLSDLNAEYNRIFNEKNELTPIQSKILELRTQLTETVTDDKLLKSAEDIETAARIRKNTDYFIASSEIPANEKKECLERLIYFMSDDYKINPQLKDKKLQVTDEILNDIVIKTPESKELKIKSVDQRVSGICAAISVCRKAMAYEHKKEFIDIIMEELKDSPVMSVYDITELGSGKKVEIPKTNVQYSAALNKGYRIIDASAHIRMNNAHASGDGTIQTEHYIPFDENTFGVYDDSSWYLGLGDNYSDEKILLGAIIKEKEYLKSVNSTKTAKQETQKNIKGIKSEAAKTYSGANGTLNKELSLIYPQKSDKEISQLIRNIIEFYKKKGDDNELYISEKMPDELRYKVLFDYIENIAGNASTEEKSILKSKVKNIDIASREYIKADEQLKKLQKFNNKRADFIYNRKLYKAAAAHRIAIEADVNMPDGILRFEKLSGLPVRNKQIVNYLNKIADKTGNTEALNDAAKIEHIIPSEVNKILEVLTDKNMADIEAEILTHHKNLILNGDKDALYTAAERLDIKSKDKNKVIDKLDKLTEKLASNPSSADINETVRILGYENEMVFSSKILTSALNSFQEGIADEDYIRLAKFFDGEENIENGINHQRLKFEKLINEYNKINKKWNIPSQRELILNKLEKNKEILSIKQLNMLQSHFSHIEHEQAKNEKIQNMKEREKADNRLYCFTDDEENIFRKIEKNLPKMNRYAEMQYNVLNRYLCDVLEEQYSSIGMLNGQFWVMEEGSSGLMANEKLRIMEQMTGKPYHIEHDITEAVKQIKQGKGGGVISMSVDDSDYAFHAMYLPAVTEETFTTDDGKKENQDVLWADNSWGLAEKEHFWKGKDGFKYTDYDRGFGWKNGFLLRDNLTIGLKVKDIFSARGTSKEDNDNFGLFQSVLLEGTPSNTKHKLDKMFGYIFRVHEGEKQLETLEELIKKGNKPNINYVKNIDAVADAKSEALAKRIKNEIKSEDDYNKLPDDDPIKFTFDKMSLYMAIDDPENAEEVLSITNRKDLEKFHDEMITAHINLMGAIIAKYEDCIDDVQNASMEKIQNLLSELKEKYNFTVPDEQKDKFLTELFRDDEKLDKLDGNIDNLEKYFMEQVSQTSEKYIKDNDVRKYFEENAQDIVKTSFDNEVRITSLESNAIKNNSLGETFIAAIDKYIKPVSDKDLLDTLQGFQRIDNKTAEDFLNLLSDEDLGLNIKKPYDYLRLFLSENSAVTKAFSEIVEMEEINKLLPDEDDENKKSPDILYRNLHVKLSEMDVQKYIKSYKDEAFKKYKVRQAFPEPVVVEDAQIKEMVENTLNKIKDSVDNIEKNKYVINLLTKYEELYDKYLKKDNFENIIASNTDTDFIKGFKQTLDDICKIAGVDESVDYMGEPLKALRDLLKSNSSEKNSEEISEYINQIISNYEDFESSGVSIQQYKDANNTEKNKIKECIHASVYSNIEPKYQDEAIKQIKNIISLYKKSPENEEINYYEDKLANLMTEKHYVKNPTVLLQEYVKLLNKGKEQTTEALNMKDYLKLALSVAEQTKVQYKLVQNQHEAISSKTKDMLPNFFVELADGSKHKMTSEVGMVYLIQQLQNYNDNNVILKLFLSQAGLTRQAVNVLIDNFNIAKNIELVEESYKNVNDNINCAGKISDEAAKFLNQSQIKYNSTSDAIQHFERYMKSHLNDIKDSDAYKKFFEYLNYFSENSIGQSNNQKLYNSILVEIYKSCLMNIADDIDMKMDNINDTARIMQDCQLLINSLEIPENCKEFEKREKFNEEFNKIYKLLAIKEKEAFAAFEQCSAFDAKKEE